MEVTGVVLAGGMGRRLGRNKVIEPLGGEPLIDRVIGRLSQVADRTVVIVNSRERADELHVPNDVKVAVDIHPNRATLGGIFTGLSEADTQWSIVVACDMPFLNAGLLRKMLELREGYDAVVPVVGGYPEPTHAVYSKTCLPAIERKVLANDLKIARFFEDVRVNFLAEDQFERLDPEGLSFFNINTQQDLDRAHSLVAQGR
jgi:molybdopterin-guanine dinucleotide biosynthesis protein A